MRNVCSQRELEATKSCLFSFTATQPLTVSEQAYLIISKKAQFSDMENAGLEDRRPLLRGTDTFTDLANLYCGQSKNIWHYTQNIQGSSNDERTTLQLSCKDRLNNMKD